jgi:FixJ family two-component response regulator
MNIKKIAIVDDNQNARSTLASMLQLVGFEPFLVESKFTSINSLSQYIRENSQAVICDHRLKFNGFATFDGAELMPSLYSENFPSILMTQYIDEISVSVRKYRDKIPVVLEREELVDPNTIADTVEKGFDICLQEFQGRISSKRRIHRTLINIVNITSDSGEDVVEVFVPSWNPYHAVRFPVSQIPDELMHTVKSSLGQNEELCLFACVNTGAEKADDLYFTRFELAPELDENDGLA